MLCYAMSIFSHLFTTVVEINVQYLQIIIIIIIIKITRRMY